ncbi:MAG: family 10 glycosylhydrolase [Verrucomicrobia bacterium]|nr:family 10 glycosylhydrolase [Verrucomicrobiota bacterium]
MKWIKTLLVMLLGAGVVVVVVHLALRSVQPPQPPVRALWVTRFDYTKPDDVRQIINNVAEAGFTDVFFQIRGNGTAFYKSQLEPWAFELSGEDVGLLGTDPGWDPLQLALDTARPSGLRVHAYMNVLPGWKGLANPPTSKRQLWTAHSDWFMVDSLGQKMLPTAGWYAFINPVLPEVRAYLRGIVGELCQYDVAGIHLDYIRYPEDYRLVAREHYPAATDEELLRHSDFSYDPVSQAVLLERYGWDVSKEKITQFRCDSVTRVVRDISYIMQMKRPGRCLLTASVMGNPVDGRAHAYQDSGAWVRQGLVDWVVQMNYGTQSFDPYLKAIRKATGRRGFKSSVVVGLYCKNDVDEVAEQIDKVGASGSRGFALFSYSFLFDETHRKTEKGRILLAKIR